MEQIKKIMEQMTGRAVVEPLFAILEANVAEFAETQKGFTEAIRVLKDKQSVETTPSVEDVEQAIYTQAAALALYSGLLGLKANADHFGDPVARTFLDVDYDIYLRENAVRRLPDCQSAQEIRNQFAKDLSPSQQEEYEAITEYVCFLESVLPKLAHYCGYLLGNELFPKIIPGYYADLNMTLQYRARIQDYFGIALTTLCCRTALCIHIHAMQPLHRLSTPHRRVVEGIFRLLTIFQAPVEENHKNTGNQLLFYSDSAILPKSTAKYRNTKDL